ncbi:MAG: tRNA pseudouridine(38-40) synthase TruA [Dehalococcoidia bacterium]|nr:tRNA pseudouridine(38-40) synthase TruA [Dehalococcoidia bacterium]
MPNLMLVLEYDGAGYHGFQKQVGAVSIQGELEKALKKLTGVALRTSGASRTDAGAHALGQVVSFHTEASFPPQTWVRALAFYLPQDIAVIEARVVDDTFHARRSAKTREYRYSVWNRPVPSPFRRRYSHHVPYSLSVDAMKEAASAFVGIHDFRAFASVKGTRGKSSMRMVKEASVSSAGDMISFRFVGNAFLPQQVRTMVGTLLEVGSGKMAPGVIGNLLESGERFQAGPTAPACGLCLVKVNYALEPDSWTFPGPVRQATSGRPAAGLESSVYPVEQEEL